MRIFNCQRHSRDSKKKKTNARRSTYISSAADFRDETTCANTRFHISTARGFSMVFFFNEQTVYNINEIIIICIMVETHFENIFETLSITVNNAKLFYYRFVFFFFTIHKRIYFIVIDNVYSF